MGDEGIAVGVGVYSGDEVGDYSGDEGTVVGVGDYSVDEGLHLVGVIKGG